MAFLKTPVTWRGLIIFLAVALSVPAMLTYFLVGTAALDKVLDLRYRFQLAERRIDSIGQVQATKLAIYQAQRGDAQFKRPDQPSNFDGSGRWRLIGGQGVRGSWRGDYFRKTKAVAVHNGDLFVGLLAPDRGGAAVWRYDGETWSVSIDANSHPQWAEFDYVHVLYGAHGRLYAGVNDEVWVLEDGNWRRLLPSHEKYPWPSSAAAYSMTHRGDALLLGLTGGRGRIFEYSGGQWRDLSSGLDRDRSTGVYELHRHSDGRIYAGTISRLGPAVVYRLGGSVWQRIGGGRIGGSWIANGATYVLSLTSFQKRLVVTLNRNPQVTAQFVSVWAFDGDEWNPVGSQHVPLLWGQTDNFNASIVYRERLYVAAGGRPAGNASVWELVPGEMWRLVGGQGRYGSWSENRARLSGSRDATAEYPYRMVEWKGRLIVGFGDAPGAAQIWSYEPSQ